MKKFYIALLLVFIGFKFGFGQTLPYLKEPTFKEGEKLSYKLRYGMLSAANGVLSVNKSKLQFSNKNTFHLSAYGQTSSAFSLLFTVKNKYDSYIDGNTFQPYLYTEDISFKNKAFGLQALVGYRLTNSFQIGLNYKPTFFTIEPKSSLDYQHVLTFDLSWKIKLRKGKISKTIND